MTITTGTAPAHVVNILELPMPTHEFIDLVFEIRGDIQFLTFTHSIHGQCSKIGHLLEQPILKMFPDLKHSEIVKVEL